MAKDFTVNATAHATDEFWRNLEKAKAECAARERAAAAKAGKK